MKCGFALVLLCSVLASSWAWPEPSSPTGSPPVVSAPSLGAPEPTWEQLDEIWTQLEQSGQTSSTDSAQLRTALELARQQLTTLSLQLADSLTRVSALSSSLEQAGQSLQTSERSLKEVQARANRQGLELWIWRGATAAAVVFAVFAFVR